MSADDSGAIVLPEIDRDVCLPGRVLRVQGLVSMVACDDGQTRSCATRRLLKTLTTDQRHVVAAGDLVWVRPEGADRRHHRARRAALRRAEPDQPRSAALIVANVDQLLDRRQRRRAASQAKPDRPLLGDRGKDRHRAGHLHQQDRPGRARRSHAARRRLQPTRLPSSARLRGHAAWASRDCAPADRQRECR